ncbi:MAG: hypothetical protein IJ660_04795 [Alphaproteobacteria bacterium]|nr:hypothetical protein [Alphaproteobacteria bacterium]
MKNFRILSLSLLLFLGLASVCLATEHAFIEGLEDIPLMRGVHQQTQKNVSFGNEESRFIEVYLTSSKVGFKKIIAFYKESLPQLGWTYQGTIDESVIFYRDSESLTFHRESIKPLQIRVTVKNRI